MYMLFGLELILFNQFVAISVTYTYLFVIRHCPLRLGQGRTGEKKENLE